jgi:hypothetical protein
VQAAAQVDDEREPHLRKYPVFFFNFILKS